jgi:bifunctional DNA-binding transcriptional regulator/antitoxin component of YhaV-PrlF toxin-antitoxin module
MLKNLTKTKISKGYQTVVPAVIRTKFKCEPGDEVIWSIIGDDVFIRLKKRAKTDPIKELIGQFSTEECDDATIALDEIVNGS